MISKISNDSSDPVATHRRNVREHQLAPESKIVNSLLEKSPLDSGQRDRIQSEATALVKLIRQRQSPGVMSPFLVEYGLTTDEGIALMCLAEALLRVPDAATIDALISDKLVPADWGRHLGHSSSSLVNASTWALMLTGKILRDEEPDNIAQTMRRVVKRLGEPVVRTAVTKAIALIADQFILGDGIETAQKRGQEYVEQGYRYSFDMLGESALTDSDARQYRASYAYAITQLARNCTSHDIRDNPGISVKLSAIHPRYEATQKNRIMTELVDATLSLASLAKDANMGFNIDAEESDRLDLSLDVIERILATPTLADWDGFGIVVQAYSQRALPIIEWAYALAEKLDRKIMLRLVKGAYWDTEIKRAQVLGLSNFPVLTRKSSTDLSYLVCAKRLFELNDRIYPQFATHNIHTISAVMEMATDSNEFEFQRLHGMGQEVHEVASERYKYRCRIYAPVGAHEDLLAYLVRRILENGANSSFVNQLMDRRVPIDQIVVDPIAQTEQLNGSIRNSAVLRPRDIYGSTRKNSAGLELASDLELQTLYRNMERFREGIWLARPTGYSEWEHEDTRSVRNPAHMQHEVGTVLQTNPDWIPYAVEQVSATADSWGQTSAEERARILNRIADSYENNSAELIALMVRETGKTVIDALAEVREAVDFCRYYANEAVRVDGWWHKSTARGVIACISPWNFPLAIFTGQIVAALAAGNSVIAKPAEQSPLTGSRAVELMYRSGLPPSALSVLQGTGEAVGAPLVADKRIDGINFTGSVDAARLIHKAAADNGNPFVPLVAETGGLNAMIVDSTALPEQATRDIIVSAFQSAGQRCSALRMLYVQEEMATRIYDMLFGAMELLTVGDPWNIETDVGPVINAEAKHAIDDYIDRMTAAGKLRYQTPIPNNPDGYFVAPSVFEVSGIEALEGEIFGPVLHIATYRSQDLPNVIKSINDSGYGLTFGLHTRIDRRVQQLTDSINVGNMYVNRNQIGAVVGCQPFGGRGLSGTGPKAGGPHYIPSLRKFHTASNGNFDGHGIPRFDLRQHLAQLSDIQTEWAERQDREAVLSAPVVNRRELARALRETIDFIQSPVDLQGPTGESNRLYVQAKGVFVCCDSSLHLVQALATGNTVLAVSIEAQLIEELVAAGAPVIATNIMPDAASLAACSKLAGIAFEQCDPEFARVLRKDLANLDGPIIQFVTDSFAPWQFVMEKSLCIDTTAAGGNAKLLIESGS